MTVSDKLAGGTLVELPAEAGDVNAPHFQPNEAWLRSAPADRQKMAMWRWFATRHEEPVTATPHDDSGHFLYSEGEPLLADRVLHERFDALVDPTVVDALVAVVQAESGNEWVIRPPDKFSG
jgi:hypothetical protein